MLKMMNKENAVAARQQMKNASELLSLFEGHETVRGAAKHLKTNQSDLQLTGLVGSARAMVLAAISRITHRTQLVITDDLEQAGYLYNDLAQLVGEGSAMLFPSAFRRAVKYGQIDSANELMRTEVLCRLSAPPTSPSADPISSEPRAQASSPTEEIAPLAIIITYPEALAERVASAAKLNDQKMTLSVGELIDTAFLKEVLDSYGFTQVDYVYEPGQYALRGSIVDLFSFANEYPFRIDFFGDEVESLRTFEVETQLSKEETSQIAIVGQEAIGVAGGVSLCSYLPTDAIVTFTRPIWARERWEELWADTTQLAVEEALTTDQLHQIILSPTELSEAIDAFAHRIYLSRSNAKRVKELTFTMHHQPACHKNFDLIAASFADFLERGYTLCILSDTDKQHLRLRTIFEERGDEIPFIPITPTLHEGFADDTLRLCLFTDHQTFDRFHKYNLRSDKMRAGKVSLSLKELSQFELGDFVVHIDHGIGRFGGLMNMKVGDTTREVVKILYTNDDIVLVSIHALHKLSKYKGKEGVPPRVSRLGSGAWERMKEKTKAKMKDIARDLIVLYAKRKDEEGFAFSPDSYLQHELEASFIYEDTPDQHSTTAQVKADMERTQPMDRLICGDVGFGKTEIAVRAAFKAVADSKQVALLVPTTILAFQHHRTFTERLKELPCTVEYISRARTAKQIKEILQRLKEGKIDILIGTHRLVGKDVVYKDLGLLIIDEEQKFGVAHKEKIRALKSNIDTLTLTATPIPRTLQFSLMGARDLSTITTPPPNRQPIQTELHRFGEEIIREAIEFELSRNGQIYFIHNRVNNIYEIETFIRRTVPDARIAIGHGQMKPDELETILIDFANHEYDILIATSIVENGIDISNANTMIVNNAHQFGLSDLHQLRGRIGRSNRKAYCYLLSPALPQLTPEARRRLEAIENYSDLGSGIHIAMQDLDIRGAGNLLGAEQSGFIADLGYEAYQRILEEAVHELKSSEFAHLFESDEERERRTDYVRETIFESDLEIFFPADYVPNDSERIHLYRELDKIERDEELKPYVARLKDRFGRLPAQAQELVRVVELRRRCRRLGIERVTMKGGLLILHTVSNPDSNYYESKLFGRLVAFTTANMRRCSFREMQHKIILTIKEVTAVADAIEILKQVNAATPSDE